MKSKIFQWNIVQPGIMELAKTPFKIIFENRGSGKKYYLYDKSEAPFYCHERLQFLKQEAEAEASDLHDIGLIVLDEKESGFKI